MTTVPKAVKRQAEQAEKLRKQQYEGNQDTEQQAEQSALEQEAESQQEREKQQEPAAQQAEPTATEDDYQKLQAAHKALQGKYNAEVPRLNAQVRELQQQLQQAQAQKAQAEKQTEQAQADLKAKLESVRSEYGDDLADTLAEVAQKNQQDTQQAGNEQERFYRNLLRAIPDFEAINSDPAFIQWLQQPSPVTGLAYQQELNEAGGDLDVNGVIHIVNAFKQSQQKQDTRSKAESQVAAPKKSAAANVQQKPKYTVDDFTKLQNDILKGRYRGREAEARALEKEIHAALTQ